MPGPHLEVEDVAEVAVRHALLAALAAVHAAVLPHHLLLAHPPVPHHGARGVAEVVAAYERDGRAHADPVRLAAPPQTLVLDHGDELARVPPPRHPAAPHRVAGQGPHGHAGAAAGGVPLRQLVRARQVGVDDEVGGGDGAQGLAAEVAHSPRLHGQDRVAAAVHEQLRARGKARG